MKMMMIKTLALLTVCTAAPAFAATPGTLGSTSTGTFDMTLNVQPPTGTQVEIFGLDDLNFGTVNTSNTAATPVPYQDTVFCMTRSDAGQVRVTMSQPGVATGDQFRLNGSVSNLPGGMLLFEPAAGAVVMVADTPVNVAPSLSGCDGSSSGSVGNMLRFQVNNIPEFNTVGHSGAYTATITVTVSVP